MTSTREHEILRHGPEGSPNESRPETAPATGPRIADLAVPNAISLPAWFTSAQARAVLQLKARSFVLIAGAHGIDRVASREALAAAPPDHGISGSAVPLGPGVTPSTSVAEALRLMGEHAVDHVAVVVAGAVLGVVTREQAAGTMARASTGSTKARGPRPNRLAA